MESKKGTKTVTLYAHAGSHNHGCEAIVRTTAEMLRAGGRDVRVILISGKSASDIKYGLDNEDTAIEIVPSSDMGDRRAKLWYCINGGLCKLFGRTVLLKRHNRALLRAAEKSDMIMSVGGDNYSENNAVLLSRTDIAAREKCPKSVLSGCSLDERWLDRDKNSLKIENLRAFSLITARESVTYDTLTKKLGLTNVRLFPDPAFALPADDSVPPIFPEGNTVGINISPLISNFQKDKSIIGENYLRLVKYILEKTDMHIALIPHVTWCDGPSDLDAIQSLADALPASERVHTVPDMNCMRLKGYIKRCRVFVCARTHASIAAYSTCVPTLVAGYSVKALGIAKDIFGTSEGYVVPVQSLKSPDDLLTAFLRLDGQRDTVRAILSEVMPDYIARSKSAAEALSELLDG